MVFAFDIRAGVPRPAWRFEPMPATAAQGVACCDVVNRGAAYADGRVFFNTLDNQTIALDARQRQASCGARSSATSRRARR